MGKVPVPCLLAVAFCLLNAYPTRAQLTDLSIVGKPAEQSSNYVYVNRVLPFYASRAVDGSLSTFQHTDGVYDDGYILPHPWWRVDLEDDYLLGVVTVYLRIDCCGERRFAGAVVRAGLNANFTFNQPCGQPVTLEQSVTGAVLEFLCAEPRLARYVSVDIDDTRPEVTEAILTMAEVTIKIIPAPQQAGCGISAAGPVSFTRLMEASVIGNPFPLSCGEVSQVTLCAVHCIHTAGCMSFTFGHDSHQCCLYNFILEATQPAQNNGSAIYTLN